MGLQQVFVEFRKGPYFRVFYVVVLALIVFLLTTLGGCMTLILVPVVMFLLPYWLKERRVRAHAVNGLAVLVIAGLLVGGGIAASYSSDPVPLSASYGTAPDQVMLVNGTVTPLRGSPNTEYNFTVTLKVPAGGNAAEYIVYVNTSLDHVTDYVYPNPVVMTPVDPGDANLTDGKGYYATILVADDVYYFWFAAVKTGGALDFWYLTTGEYGPIVAGFGSFFVIGLFVGMLYLMLPIISLYYLVLMVYWYTQRARVLRERQFGVPSVAETDTGFMCTNCGADVPESATKCPKCGAEFQEEPAATKEEPPKAGEEPDAKP